MKINLQTIQSWLDKINLLIVVSFSDTDYRLGHLWIIRKGTWEKDFKGTFNVREESDI